MLRETLFASCVLSDSSIGVAGWGYRAVTKMPREAAELFASYSEKSAGPVQEAFIEVRDEALAVSGVCQSAQTKFVEVVVEW